MSIDPPKEGPVRPLRVLHLPSAPLRGEGSSVAVSASSTRRPRPLLEMCGVTLLTFGGSHGSLIAKAIHISSRRAASGPGGDRK